MSKLVSDSPGSEPADGEALSTESQELLVHARRQRREQPAPDSARQRALARALAEATRPAVLAMPSPALVRVARPSRRVALRTLAAAALFVALIVGAPWLFRTLSARLAPGAEPDAAGDWSVSGPAGELLKPTSPVFRLPLLPLDHPPTPAPSALGARPFSPQDRAWQVRRWNDPKAPPEALAAHSIDRGAVCVMLRPGDRVLGGWPWPAEGSEPELAKLVRGRSYRLSFRAWVAGSLPSQVLLGVGHSQFPFVAAAAARVQVSTQPEAFAMDFVAAQDDDAAGVAFLATNSQRAEPTRVCFGEMQLSER